MTYTTHRCLVLTAVAVLLALGALSPCWGQEGPPSAGPKLSADAPSAVPNAVEELPAPRRELDRSEPYVLPPLPNYAAIDGPISSPWLDRPDAAPPGFVCNVESSIVFPRFHSLLQGGQITLAQTSGVAPNSAVGLPPGDGLPITGDIVNFPFHRLNITVTPRIELGYRFPEGFGEVRLGYRFMDSSGSDSVFVNQLGFAAQRNRLDVQFIDLDYATREFALPAGWELRPAVGVRYATAFLDSRVAFRNPVPIQEVPFGTAPFTRLTQYEAVSSRWIGAHAVMEIGRKLGVSGWTFFGRAEGSGLYGRTHQTFTETFVEAPGFTGIRVTNGVGAPIVAAQAGFSHDVPRWNHSRFLIGYQYEAWWQFGRGNNDQSFGTLTDQGLFLRGEFNF